MQRVKDIIVIIAAVVSAAAGVTYFVLDSGLTKAVAIIIVLTSIIVILVLLIWVGINLFNELAGKRYKDPYILISSFVRYTTFDGQNYVLESFKHIQAKRAVVRSYSLQFKWSGTKRPRLTSGLQSVGGVSWADAAEEYDKVELIFNRPLLYNQVGVVHLIMDIDDSDYAGSPHLGTKVDIPREMLRWDIELLNRETSASARFLRRKIDSSTPQGFVFIENVGFIETSRSYKKTLLKPDVGYHYRIEWDRE